LGLTVPGSSIPLFEEESQDEISPLPGAPMLTTSQASKWLLLRNH